MPRVTSRRIETPELQGEGSFVLFRKLSWGTAKKARRFMMIGDVRARADLTVEEIDKMLAEEAALTIDLVANGVLLWNWQDENGQPLHPPKSTEDLDLLTTDEVTFIVSCCSGNYPSDQLTETEAKN